MKEQIETISKKNNNNIKNKNKLKGKTSNTNKLKESLT